MSNLSVESTEPDPAATSLPNDENVKKEGSESSVPTSKGAVMAEVESKESNGASEVKKENPTETNGTAAKVKAEESDEKDVTEKKLRFDEKGVLKTSVKIEDDQEIKYSKYDPSILPATDDPTKIRAQVEFYFGDTNLPTDKFLWDETNGEENRPVPIATICKFGRMKRFQPVSAVVAALKESKFLVVVGEEGEEKVKRAVAYDATANRPSKNLSRSVYVKGFGDEEPSSQFDIEAFFAPYGPVNAVRLRRTPEKLFKGSVFVEFADDELAEKFLALEPKPQWKGKFPLSIQSKKSYIDGKNQDIKDGKIDPMPAREAFRGRGRGRGGNRGDRGHYRNDRDGGRGRGDRDPDDWKKRREEDRASGFRDNKGRNDRGNRNGDRDGSRTCYKCGQEGHISRDCTNSASERKGRGGGRREDRGPRSDDRNREREEKNREVKDEPTEKSEIKSEDAAAIKTEDSPKNEKKRAREEDGETEQPAKKVDVKSEVSVEAS